MAVSTSWTSRSCKTPGTGCGEQTVGPTECPPQLPAPVVPAVCPRICHGAPQKGDGGTRIWSVDTATTMGTGEVPPAQLSPSCGCEEVARGCSASCLSDAVTSSSGEELCPAVCPLPFHGEQRKPAASTAPRALHSPLHRPAQPHSPLVEVVLGVVQPQPHGHRVALPTLCEDVVHGGCGRGRG